MPIPLLARHLSNASSRRWAIGHFNASESDQFRAIAEAAKELEAPVMVGTSEGEAKHLGYDEAVALRDAFRKELGVELFLNADHHKSVEAAKRAVDAGYDSVHIDLSAETLEENIAGTQELLTYAKSRNPEINVEGELGYLRGESAVSERKIIVSADDYTDPAQAKTYADATRIDRLGIAVGNIHGITLDEPNLDIERIRNIRDAVPAEVALVLHAGSGIPEEQIKAAIRSGIANIHINTDIRVAYTDALRKSLEQSPKETTPYKFDAYARDILKEFIKMRIELFRSTISP